MAGWWGVCAMALQNLWNLNACIFLKGCCPCCESCARCHHWMSHDHWYPFIRNIVEFLTLRLVFHDCYVWVMSHEYWFSFFCVPIVPPKSSYFFHLFKCSIRQAQCNRSWLYRRSYLFPARSRCIAELSAPWNHVVFLYWLMMHWRFRRV